MRPGLSCARAPARRIDPPISPRKWRRHAAGYAQLLDTRHLMYVWGNVDRGCTTYASSRLGEPHGLGPATQCRPRICRDSHCATSRGVEQLISWGSIADLQQHAKPIVEAGARRQPDARRHQGLTLLAEIAPTAQRPR
jgi:hypothetical protein